MKVLHSKVGPYMQHENRTSKIMMHVLIALLPIIIFSFIKNGYIPFKEGYIDSFDMLRPLILIIVGALTSSFSELFYYKFISKLKGKEITDKMKNSYALFPGLFLALIIPINTPIIILIMGAMIATFVGKILFGGFGHNVFNPALIGALFILTMYGGFISSNGGYLNPKELDAVASATPLSVTTEGIGTYEQLVEPHGDLTNFFVGTIPGSVGETSSVLIILAFIYLTIFKVIKWRIPLVYISTVFIMTFLIGTLNDLTIWYPLFQVLSGGLLFGAVFMATDPVTSPTTEIGQILYGLFLAILTVSFRYLTPYPEGVLTAILTMNMFVIIIDRIGAKAKFNFNKAVIPFMMAWLIIPLVSYKIASDVKVVEKKDESFQITNIEKNGSKHEYTVIQKGFAGNIEAIVTVDNSNIIAFEIISQSESYFIKIENADYVSRLIETNGEVDTVSGATITSTALKNIAKRVIEDYEK